MALPRLSLPLLLILAVPALAQRAHVAPPLPEPLRPMFGGPQYFSMGESRELASADMDGDGDIDLVVSQEYSYLAEVPKECWYPPPVVDVLRNRGDGSFDPPESNALPFETCLDSGQQQLDMTVADLDGDGSPDVAARYADLASPSNPPELAVLANLGNGQLTTLAEYQVPGGEESLLSADLDHDGDVDLVRGNAGTDRVNVLRNQGNGTFVPTTQLGLPVDFLQTSADLDADGDVDLVDGRNSIDVFSNLGSGTFALGASTMVGAFAFATHADLDRDGYEDLVTGHGSVLRNLGNGAFAPPVHHDTGGDQEHVAVGDLDRDGDADVVVSYAGSRNVAAVLSNLGGGSLAPVVPYDVGSDPVGLVVANIDGDGRLDVATVSSFGTVTVQHNRGNGTFPMSDLYEAIRGPNSLTDADLDADGDQDLVIAAYSQSDDIQLLWNAGDGSFPVQSLSVGPSSSDIKDADLDGNGTLDLVVANGFGHTVTVVMNQGDGSFSSPVGYGEEPRAWDVTGADLDGDGDADLATLWEDEDTGSRELAVLQNHGSGTFGPLVHYPAPHQLAAWSIVQTDVDGDGDLDLATVAEGGPVASPDPVNSLAVFPNLGDGTFGSPSLDLAVGGQLISLDLDADGDQDFATAGLQDWYTPVVAVLLNHGDGTLAPSVRYPVLGGEFALTGGDLNGDGAPDLVANTYVSAVWVLRNRGDGVFRPALAYTAPHSGSQVRAVDVDGDGDVDLATLDYLEDAVAVHRNLRR